jgi:2,4-didehydro-3-deoxy-L-rhamnonate hydrolase
LHWVEHAAEAGLAVPPEPIIFLKANSALCGPNDDTIKPLVFSLVQAISSEPVMF